MRHFQHRCLNLLLLVAILLLFTSVTSAAGQAIVVDPPPERRPPGPPEIELGELSVNASIDGPVATVRLRQVFTNRSDSTVEGTYLFPLPPDAAVGDFTMTDNGRTLEGRLYHKDEARRIYEEIVRRRRDPALLEYLDHNLFQARVFPIPPGESRTLELNYSQVLQRRDGLYRFAFPLKHTARGLFPDATIELHVDLRSQSGLRTVYSPTYPVTVRRAGDAGAAIHYASGDRPGQDFVLFFGTDDSAIGLDVISYNPAVDDGFFVMLAAPAIDVEAAVAVERDIILVIDVSGSMQGEKIEQAREAAHIIVEKLNPGDRFNLITFSTGARLWQNNPIELGDNGRDLAHEWIDGIRAEGSTDINRALLEALAQLRTQPERAAYVLFLTDGLPTQGVTDAAQIVHNAGINAPDDRPVRLFTFGIGYDVNTDLLNTLSRDLGGRSSYVLPDERIDEAVGVFYAGISTPVLIDVDFDFGDAVVVDDVYPFPLPDLFAGEQLVAVGRYRLPPDHDGQIDAGLSGVVNGADRRYDFPDRRLAIAGGEPAIARLWATRKLGSLMDQVRIGGPDKEIVDAIVDLSLRYGIVTPYTSYLVLEPEWDEGPTAEPGRPMALSTPVALRALAADAVQAEAEAVAEAPAMGEAGVRSSMVRSALRSATTVDEHEAVRYVAGRTFARQGQVEDEDGILHSMWVDTLYEDSMAIEEIPFGSVRYFEAAGDPQIASWMAISPEILLVIDDANALRFTLSAGWEEGVESQEHLIGADEVEEAANPWEFFRIWLARFLR